MDWKLLRRHSDTLLELWKTPTKYLVCKTYERFYKFFDTHSEALAYFDAKMQES